jgi:exodeoxyribonuclease III
VRLSSIYRPKYPTPMKISTYNVNGINARLPALLRWLDHTRPDIACLQELKASGEKIPSQAIEQTGYGAAWHGEKGWNGVAILARGEDPKDVSRTLHGEPGDTQSRYVEATVKGIRVACLYLPNGNPAPGPKFDYKLRWMNRLAVRAQELSAAADPAILAGDFNIIPTPMDVYNPASWSDDALYRPEVRQGYRQMIEGGWTDALRATHPGERVYTFYDYFRNAFARNAGLRIDHLLLNRVLASRLLGAGVDLAVRGWERPSDHVPTWAIVED